MTQTLKITFTIETPDNLLERGAVLTAAHQAAQAFVETMSGAKHKATYVAEESAPARKARTPVVVARAAE